MINTSLKYIGSIPLALAFGMFFVSCENDLKEVERLTNYESLPIQTIEDSKIKYTDSARVQFMVEAGVIDRFISEEEERDEFSNGVRVTTYNKQGGFESQIDAENATNYPKEKIMIARDSVVLKNYEGKTLETELLTWDEKEDRIYTDKFVKITTPTEILYGDGLESTSDFSRYEIQNIKGRIKIDTEEPDTNERVP